MEKGTYSSEQRVKIYRRTLIVIMLSQIFAGTGIAAGVTVGALLAQSMLGTESFAGLPTALFTLGSAGAALLVGRISQHSGRRIGISLGFWTASIGAIGIVTAAAVNSVPLLFICLFIYGAGAATNLQARYAGTDLALPTQRATAISIAMVSTTFGAVAGPNLVEVTGHFAGSLGLPELAGPFLLAAVAYLIAGVLFFALLRPDPLLMAKAIAEASQQQGNGQGGGKNASSAASSATRGIVVGATIMTLSQLVMVAIMTMTPIHMQHHGHRLSDIGLVIGIHIGAMFLPSLITGVLVDRYGRVTMSIASGAILLLAGLLAALAPADSLVLLIVALALLGLGWNLGVISGTALIVDATEPAQRAVTQGKVDVLIALTGATGGALSGIVVAHSSYAILSLSGGCLALLLIPVIVWSLKK